MENVVINENTPFRFIVRKGLNSERLQCILSEGEIGYTTDTKRIFVGDGITMGGNPINNIVLSGSSTVLPNSALIAGDIIYNTQFIKIYNGNGAWLTYNINPNITNI